MDLASLAGRVVTGADGSSQSVDAAGWAADRAIDRGKALTLLVAIGRPGNIAPGLQLAADVTDQLAKAQEKRVQDMATDLRDRNLGLDVNVLTVPENAAHAMIGASEFADPLVIGTRGLGRLSGHLLGAVADQVVSHARGTVVVVPTRVWHMPGQKQADIVVGYDYSNKAAAAMDFAFAEAEAEGVGVRVIQGLELGELWDLRPIDILGGRDPLASYQARLEASLEPWRERHPGVAVRCLVRQGASASVLLADESVDASLMVVGNRGLGGFVGLMLGSTARRLLHHARCPVAVVR